MFKVNYNDKRIMESFCFKFVIKLPELYYITRALFDVIHSLTLKFQKDIFRPIFHFYTPQNTRGFLTFSEGEEMEYRFEIG